MSDQPLLASSSASFVDEKHAESKTVILKAKNVSFSRLSPNDELPFYKRFFSPNVEKEILHDISATFRPGELTAIMGPSGAGKTTLLNVLASRASGVASGEVLINGVALKRKETRMVMKVVPQDDILIESLTPYDILSYTFKLFYGLGRDDMDAHIYSLLNKLGLGHVANVHVGSSLNPGLSGGQKKRTSIALELITDPGLLFLDEPTSGLDSRTAFELVKMLKELANTGRNIICTIHQPSYEVFSMFDRLLLLEDGRVAFNGPVEQVVPYFKDCGYECPMYHNPADFVFEAMAQERLGGVNSFAERWRIHTEDKGSQKMHEKGVFLPIPSLNSEPSPWRKESEDRFEEKGIPGSEESEFLINSSSLLSASPSFSDVSFHDGDFNYHTSWFLQFYVLSLRGFYMTFTDKQQFRGRMIAISVVALFFGLVYFQLEDTQQTAQDRVSVLFSMLMFTGMNMMMMTVMLFPLEREIVTREYQNGTYAITSYYLARLLTSWVFQMIYTIWYLVILYFMVGLFMRVDRFLITYATLLLVACLSVTLGILIGAWIPSPQLVTNVVSPVLMPLIILCGFFIRPENIPPWFIWLHDISFFNYSLQMLVHAQFRDLYLGSCIPNTQKGSLNLCPLGPSFCPDDSDVEFPTDFPLPTTCVYGDNMIYYLGFQHLTVNEDAIILGSILLVASLFGLLVMFWRVSRKVG